MCHDVESRPPTPPGGPLGESVGEHLTVSSADGNHYRAYRAAPAGGSAATPGSVLLLPDIRGLHPYYERLADLLAGLGRTALVMDYYGRTAGAGPRTGFDGADHLPMLQHRHVEADAAAAVAALPPGPVYSLGFCLGGAYSWRLSGAGLGLAGCIGFYGPPRFFADRIPEFQAPLLMLLAGADVATTREEFDGVAAALTRAGKPFAMHTYDRAPHSFFDGAPERWQPACADAWQRMLAFLAGAS
jgi:carboxymethylenebutenolidase